MNSIVDKQKILSLTNTGVSDNNIYNNETQTLTLNTYSGRNEFLRADEFLDRRFWVRNKRYRGYILEHENDISLIENLRKLEKIGELGPDWNGYGACPFSKSMLRKAKWLIKSLNIQPEIFPTADGTIQLEWNGKNESYLEIQFSEDEEVQCYCITAEHGEKNFCVKSNIIDIEEVVLNFYGF